MAFAALANVVVLMPASAQTRGNTVTQPYQVTFQTGGQSQWGPADATANIDFRYTLWDVAWSESGETGDVVGVGGFDFGGRIRGSTGGATGLAVRFHNVETGSVDLVYPVDIVLTLPEPNSFRDGETVTFSSAYSLGAGWVLNTTPPALDITFEGRFGFQASSGVDVCLFGCTGFPLSPTINIPNSSFEVMRLSGASGTVSMPAIPGASVNVLPHTFTFLESNFHGIGGTVDRPRVVTSGGVLPDGTGLRATGSHRFIDISIDWDSYLTKATGVGLGAETPSIGGASAFYDILDFRSLVAFTETKLFEFLPDLGLTAVLPEAVNFTVTDELGNVVSDGTSNTIFFKVGHSVTITIPAGRRDPLEHQPTFTLANTFSSATTGEVQHDFVMTALQLGLTVPSVVVIPEICDPTGVLGCTPEVKSPRIDLDLGPLYRQTLTSQTVPLSFYPGGTWELQGIAPQTRAPFFLDPEDPTISVATSLNSSVLEGTGPPGTLTQRIHVTNTGDVRLSSVQLADALRWAIWWEDGGPYFIPVEDSYKQPDEEFFLWSTTSDHLTLVEEFDGSERLNMTKLAAGNDTLGVGQTASIEIVMTSLHSRIYGAQLNTSGVSPIGTPVAHDTWNTLGVFKLDINECRLPRWRRRVSGYIDGTRLMDVKDVDLASLRVEGVAPVEAEAHGYHKGGRIWFEFDQDELVDSLRSRLEKIGTSVAEILAMEQGSDRDSAVSISAEDVAEQLLDGTSLLDGQQMTALDQLGNGNGQLDLGDLRALLLAQDALLTESRTGERDLTEAVSQSGDEAQVANMSQSHRGRCRPRWGYAPVPVIITGNFKDGTSFIGEDIVNIRKEG
jgi:hypothetical protein